MALHPKLPTSPYETLAPEQRWFPADESLRERPYEKLLPPLVANIRREVAGWRAEGYAGASPTSRALLQWWFETEHALEASGPHTVRIDYVRANGELSTYTPDFIVRDTAGGVWIVETKGREELDLQQALAAKEREFRELILRACKAQALYGEGAAEAGLKEGKSAVVCHDGQLHKLSESKAGVLTRERLTKAWTDWVDYWAVDFDCTSRKEITVAVKVIEIFGNDTMTLVPVNIG
jgi:hypothetical protein